MSALGEAHVDVAVENGYFSSGWNWLDFIVVVASLVSLSAGVGVSALTVLRAFRLLRPLRAIQSVPRFKIIIDSVVNSVRPTLKVFVVLLFFFVIFAAISLDAFMGKLHGRCYDVGTGLLVREFEDRPCSMDANGSFKCGPNATCKKWGGGNPRNGTISFDNIFDAFYSLFWVSTLTSWDFVMYACIDAVDPLSSIYFIIFIFSVSFFATNLVLAVIADTYSEEANEYEAERSTHVNDHWDHEEKVGAVVAIREAATTIMQQQINFVTNTLNEEYRNMTEEYHASERDHLPLDRKFLLDEQKNNRIFQGNRHLNLTGDTLVVMRGRKSTLSDQQDSRDLEGDGLVKIGRSSENSTLQRTNFGEEHPLADSKRHSLRNGDAKQPPLTKRKLSMEASERANKHQMMLANADKTKKKNLQQFCRVLQNTKYDRRSSVIFNTVMLEKGRKEKRPEYEYDPYLDKLRLSIAARHLLGSHQIRIELQKEWRSQVWKRLQVVGAIRNAFIECCIAMKPLAAHLHDNVNRERAHSRLQNPAFHFAIAFATCIDVVVSCTYHDGMSDELSRILIQIAIGTTGVFIVEAAWKLYGLGPRYYLASILNRLDLALVLISVGEIAANETRLLAQIRVVKLFRMFTTMTRFENLNVLLQTIYKSIPELIYVGGLLFLFVFIFTIVGVQNFAGKLDDLDDPPRQSFDTFYKSFLVVFQMFSGDSWPDITWVMVAATNRGAIIFSCLIYLLGTFVLMNIFVAALLAQMQIMDEDKIAHLRVKMWLTEGNQEYQLLELAKSVLMKRVTRQNHLHGEVGHLDRAETTRFKGKCEKIIMELVHRYDQLKEKEMVRRQSMQEMYERIWNVPEEPRGTALLVFGPTNGFRTILFNMMSTWWFDLVMTCFVLLTCVILALDNPHQEQRYDSFPNLSFAIEIIFTIEMAAKWIVRGVLFTPDAYFKDVWNYPDFIALFAGWIGITVVKSVRAVRPLRIIARFRGMKVVLTSLWRAVPAVWNISIFCCVLLIIFGVFTVSLFKGTFGYCADDSVPQGSPRSDCPEGQWRNADTNFDNIGTATLTLFQLATLSDWNEIMYRAIDATGKDQNRQENYNEPAGIIFVLAAVILGFFMINLFVGALINAFNDSKHIVDGQAFMTERQCRWIQIRNIIQKSQLLPFRTDKPESYIPCVCWYICGDGYDMSHPFEICISVVLIANTLVLCMQHYGQPEAFVTTANIFSTFTTSVFCLEAVIKMTAWGPRGYLKTNWNRFDLTLATVSFLAVASGASFRNLVNIVRILRIFRVLRFIKRFKVLQNMFDTLVISIPAAWNVASVLFVIFFIFAIFGVQFFGKVLFTETGFSDNANFTDFPHAILVLFRVATGDMWELIMYGATIDENNSDCSRSEGNCGYSWAPIYFVLFVLMAGLVMINLFVAIVLENFSNARNTRTESAQLNIISKWRDSWSFFDRHNSGKLDPQKALAVIIAAPAPFGFGKKLSYGKTIFAREIKERTQRGIDAAVRSVDVFAPYRWKSFLKRLEMLNIKMYRIEGGWKVRYEDMVNSIARLIFRLNESVYDEPKNLGDKSRESDSTLSQATMYEWYAVNSIQAFWKRVQHRKRQDRDIKVCSPVVRVSISHSNGPSQRV